MEVFGKLKKNTLCGFAVTSDILLPQMCFYQSRLKILRTRCGRQCGQWKKRHIFSADGRTDGNYNLSSAAEKYKNHAKSLDAEVLLIRGIILNGFATKRTIAEAEEEQPE